MVALQFLVLSVEVRIPVSQLLGALVFPVRFFMFLCFYVSMLLCFA